VNPGDLVSIECKRTVGTGAATVQCVQVQLV